MASIDNNEPKTRKRGRPRTKPIEEPVPQRKSARVEKKKEEQKKDQSKKMKIENKEEDWNFEDDDDEEEDEEVLAEKYSGMFKKVGGGDSKDLLADEDDDDEEEVSEEDEDDEEDEDEEADDLFRDEVDMDVYDFDQQSSIISSLHPSANRKWLATKQKLVKQQQHDVTKYDSWASNIYSYLSSVLSSREDLELYTEFLKSGLVNRSLDLTISDLFRPHKRILSSNAGGDNSAPGNNTAPLAAATLQNFMQKINDDEAIAGLMKHILSDNYVNCGHRISHFVFIVQQPLNGLRYCPHFTKIFSEIDTRIIPDSAFIVEADKTELKKNTPVIDTLVIGEEFYSYINDKLLLENCADLQRLLVGLDENRQLMGLFVLESWNRAGIPYDKINNYKSTLSTTVSSTVDNTIKEPEQKQTEINSTDAGEVNALNAYNNIEFCDAFIVRIGSKSDSLHLVVRVESRFLVYNIVPEENFAFKKHSLNPNTSIKLEGMHTAYNEVLGDEKSVLVISDQLYKSFIKILSREISNPSSNKVKKNVLLDAVTRQPIGVFFDTEVVIDMQIQLEDNESNNLQTSKPPSGDSLEKHSLNLASLNGLLVGLEISLSKSIVRCYQLISDVALTSSQNNSYNCVQTLSVESGVAVTLQFVNIENHENTLVSAYLYNNQSYNKRFSQIEALVYAICQQIYEMPLQLSLFDSLLRMYQFTVKLTRSHQEFVAPANSHMCIFCGHDFKTPSIALDHSIRHLGLIKFKCHKHQMVFSDFKSYKAHRDEFLDCDEGGPSNCNIGGSMETTQKLLNVNVGQIQVYQCEKCHDYFPGVDMSSSHQETCDTISFSTRTPLSDQNKQLSQADLASSSGIVDNNNSASALICGLCGLTYPKMDILSAHMTTHLSCSVCKVRMSSIDEISVHLRDHTLKNDIIGGQGRKKVFVCDICNDFYGNKNNYYYHQWNEHGVVHPPIKSSVHDSGMHNQNAEANNGKRRSKRVDELSYIATGSKKFNCKFCNADVKVSGRDYVKHLDQKHGLSVEMDCLCRICADIFETPDKLSDHLRTNHIQGGEYINAGIQSIFSCDKCTFFGHYRGVIIHSQTVHFDSNPSLYECPKCPERMTDRRLWRLHLEKHEDTQNYSCVQCETMFKTEYALKLHLTSFHGDEMADGELKCRLCGGKQNSVDELRQHVLTEHADIDATCPHACCICPERFVSLDELHHHLATNHSTEQGGSVFTCDICHKTSKSERANNLHRMKHFRTKIFQCTECHATFRSKLAMRRHIRVDHLNLEPERYECQICGKIVTQISMHMLIHKSARYQCEYCGKRFTKSAYYNEHVRIHRNEKPYECHICNRRFNKKSNLNVHIGFHEKHRDDFGNYLEIKPRGRGHPNYDPRKTEARKLAQMKFDVSCGPDRPMNETIVAASTANCIHDDVEYKWKMVALNSKSTQYQI